MHPLRFSLPARAAAVFAVLLSVSSSFAQEDPLRGSLFREAKQMLQDARRDQADILAPESFARALSHYRDAEKSFEKGRDIEGIQKDLFAAQSWLNRATAAARIGRPTFAKALAARSRAMDADAPSRVPELWENSEKQFTDAARRLESGDRNSAVSKALESTTMYRHAEVEALKVRQLGPTRQLLERADREKVKLYAPRTLKHARDLLELAEIQLRREAAVTAEIEDLSSRAEKEARRSLVLAQRVRKVAEDETPLEDLLLASEDLLLGIARVIGADASFDQEPGAIAEAIVGTARQRQADADAVSDTLAERTEQLRRLEQGSRTLQANLARHERARQVLDEIDGIFGDHEADVTRTGGDITLRLHGLVFQVGGAVIEPAYFGLLSRVRDAIRRTPGASVVVEGHTDTQGSTATNKALSQRRADAVRQYLIANSGMEGARIQAVGFGESRPVAPNDTSAGRARNRRIDVVIRTGEERI